MSLVVTRLGAINDGGCGGGGMTSPAEAKIIADGPRTRRGWGGIAGSINTDACIPGQKSDGQQPAGSWQDH